jgi:pantoate--beta-alanine ligase
MRVLVTPAEMRAWSHAERDRGSTIALVPTMGALHDGHLALIAEATRLADRIVVSIFVNPLQFDRGDDFEGYPRPIDDDVARCTSAGVDAVYAPTAATMYPTGFQTHVEPGRLAATFEGVKRPGHFRGVATVVTKLFAAVQPDVAVFGEKDFQQLAVVRRMTADLDLGIAIAAVPTVREADGLALSSRNGLLTTEDREAAAIIPVALTAGGDAFASGERSARRIESIVCDVVADAPRAALEYVGVVDDDTLEAVPEADERSRLLVAVRFGDVRLIDNCPLSDRGRA